MMEQIMIEKLSEYLRIMLDFLQYDFLWYAWYAEWCSY